MLKSIRRVKKPAIVSDSTRRVMVVSMTAALLSSCGRKQGLLLGFDNTSGAINSRFRAVNGAEHITQNRYDVNTAQEVLDNTSLPANYTTLRVYTGHASEIQLTAQSIAGSFQRDNIDQASVDNGCTIIIDALGRRWKRVYDGPVMAEWAGATGDGVTDDTAALQRWLDVAGDLASAPGKTYKTSASLFNQQPDRSVDFADSKIVNLSNSKYAFVSISPTLAMRTEAALGQFMRELHYGAEIRNSHLRRVLVQMAPNTETGANLGVGIVYGEGCTIAATRIIATNGNGIEVRNSIGCDVVDSKVSGHRNYGVFIFQSKSCRTQRTAITGGARGWISKHCHNGTGLTENILEDCTLIDASSNGRFIVGGEWLENVLTDPIYVSGHEVVRGNIVRRNKLYATRGSAPRIGLGYFADQWKFQDNEFHCNGRPGNVFTTGAEGNIDKGGTIGGQHRFEGNRIHDVAALGNAVFSAQVPTEIDRNEVTGKWGYLLLANAPALHVNAFVQFSANRVRGDQSATNLGESGIVIGPAVRFAIVEDNDLELDSVGTSVAGAAALTAMVLKSAQWSIRRNRVVITSQAASLHTSACALLATAGSGDVRDNSFRLSARTSVTGAQFTSGIRGDIVTENNTFVLAATPSAQARALVADTAVRQHGNVLQGGWKN